MPSVPTGPRANAADLARALHAGRAEDVLAALEVAAAPDPLHGDPALARVWVDALRAVPSAIPGAADRLRGLPATHPTDPGMAVAVAAALLRWAEQRPPDEPPDAEGPARDALEALAGAVPGVDAPANVRARHAIHRANALRMLGPTRDREAMDALETALRCAPDDGAMHADGALLHKWRGRWNASLDAGERALGLLGWNRGVAWNVAIAATALGRGRRAVEIWTRLGLEADVNEGGMPVVHGPDGAPLPDVDVRVPSRGAGYGPASDVVPEHALTFEVVAVTPISPCHGVVSSPTFRDTPVDWGDVVLWDGAPVGVLRPPEGPPRPRFPLLEVLRRSGDHRLRFLAIAQGSLEAALAQVERSLPEGVHLARFSERLETVEVRSPNAPTRTSLLDGVRDRLSGPKDRPRAYGKILAPEGADLRALGRGLFDVAREAGIHVVIPELHERLGDPQQAGKAHAAWRAIEARDRQRASGTAEGGPR